MGEEGGGNRIDSDKPLLLCFASTTATATATATTHSPLRRSSRPLLAVLFSFSFFFFVVSSLVHLLLIVALKWPPLRRSPSPPAPSAAPSIGLPCRRRRRPASPLPFPSFASLRLVSGPPLLSLFAAPPPLLVLHSRFPSSSISTYLLPPLLLVLLVSPLNSCQMLKDRIFPPAHCNS